MDRTDVLDNLHYLARLSKRYRSGGGKGGGDKNGEGRGTGGSCRHVSRSEMRLMRILLATDGLNAKELAEKLDIRPPSLSEVLDKLEKHGEIERHRDEKDSRVYRIRLTEHGRNRIEKHWEEYAKARLEIESCLTEEEKKTFCIICEKLIAHLISLSSDNTY